MIENPTENILDATYNIVDSSLFLDNINKYIGGESTRIMNIYSKFIGTPKEEANYKKIYDCAKKICDFSLKNEKEVNKLKQYVQKLLNTMGKM